MQAGNISLDDAFKSSALEKLQTLLHSWRDTLMPYMTARLWMQYQKMVQILRALIRSVCIGNWSLYEQSLWDMLPYLAAAGHNNYTKSLAIFIPRMLDLRHSHPQVHKAFCDGLFPVKRSDGAWSGIFTDLFIEMIRY